MSNSFGSGGYKGLSRPKANAEVQQLKEGENNIKFILIVYAMAETIQRDEETIQRDEETIQRDEETIQRDEYALLAQKGPKLEMRFYPTEDELSSAYKEKIAEGVSANHLFPFRSLVPIVSVKFEYSRKRIS
jgi:hypothetical protein